MSPKEIIMDESDIVKLLIDMPILQQEKLLRDARDFAANLLGRGIGVDVDPPIPTNEPLKSLASHRAARLLNLPK